MTIEEVKAAFRAYLPARRALSTAREAYKQMREDIDGLSAMKFDGMPRGSGTSDPVFCQMLKAERVLEKLRAETERYGEIADKAVRMLELADDIDGKNIICLRWMKGTRFDFIPAEIHMERAAMFKHYRTALSEIARRWEDERH